MEDCRSERDEETCWSFKELGPPGQPHDLQMTGREEASKENHMRLVVEAMGEIRSGKAQKIVVSRKEEVSGILVDPLNLFMRLATRYPGAFCYLWFESGTGLWAGASPETLVTVEGNNFTTMSLAGTRRDEGNHLTEWGQKEMEEQQMVTDLIVEELGSLVDDVGEPLTQRAGHLLHLRTDIRGKVTGNEGLPELIRRLHPTAAICGLPRSAALEFINRREGYDREYYTGFLGELNSPEPGRSDLFVNLRCMRLFPEERKAWIFVGGGITSSSDPEKEWEETQAKSEILKRVFS